MRASMRASEEPLKLENNMEGPQRAENNFRDHAVVQHNGKCRWSNRDRVTTVQLYALPENTSRTVQAFRRHHSVPLLIHDPSPPGHVALPREDKNIHLEQTLIY